MNDESYKSLIEKIKNLLISEKFDDGIKELQKLNNLSLNETLEAQIIKVIKNKYFFNETTCSLNNGNQRFYDPDNIFDKVKAKFNKGFETLSQLLPNLEYLDISEAFKSDWNQSFDKPTKSLELIKGLKKFNKLKEVILFTDRNLQVRDGLAKTIGFSITSPPLIFTDLLIFSKNSNLHNYVNDLFKNGCFENDIFTDEDRYNLDDMGSNSISFGYDTDAGNHYSTHEELYLKYNSKSNIIEDYTDEEKKTFSKNDLTLVNFTSSFSAPVIYLEKLITEIIKIDDEAEILFRASEEFCNDIYDRDTYDSRGKNSVLVWGGYGNKIGFKWNNREALDMPDKDDYEDWDEFDEAIGDYVNDVIDVIHRSINHASKELK